MRKQTHAGKNSYAIVLADVELLQAHVRIGNTVPVAGAQNSDREIHATLAHAGDMLSMPDHKIRDSEFMDSIQDIAEKLRTKLAGWYDSAIDLLPLIALALLIILLTFVLARVLRRLLRRQLGRTSASETVTHLLGNLTYTAALLTGLFIVLGVLGLDKTVTSLLAGAGILGLALGFPFQDVAASYLSGILLALVRPFAQSRHHDSLSYSHHRVCEGF